MANLLTKQFSVSVPANASVPNALSNTRFEYMPATGFLNLYAQAAAAGITARLLVGASEAVETSDVGTENRFPIVPDDMLAGSIFGQNGQRLTLELNNSTGAPVVAFIKLTLQQAEAVVTQ